MSRIILGFPGEMEKNAKLGIKRSDSSGKPEEAERN
jgi:hypothetical protein